MMKPPLENLNLFSAEDFTLFLRALRFSAEKHRDQRRKDEKSSPYINHPIQVAELLWEVGEVYDIMTIIVALLHDTLEDTATTPEEIERLFTAEILALVQEVSDDKSLPKEQRKQLQIQHAPALSNRAKLVKLADKICNIYDMMYFPPHDWSLTRRREYLEWSTQVVNEMRGTNQYLEMYYDNLLIEAKQQLAAIQE